jgi:hypothetical protein
VQQTTEFYFDEGAHGGFALPLVLLGIIKFPPTALVKIWSKSINSRCPITRANVLIRRSGTAILHSLYVPRGICSGIIELFPKMLRSAAYQQAPIQILCEAGLGASAHEDGEQPVSS